MQPHLSRLEFLTVVMTAGWLGVVVYPDDSLLGFLFTVGLGLGLVGMILEIKYGGGRW